MSDEDIDQFGEFSLEVNADEAIETLEEVSDAVRELRDEVERLEESCEDSPIDLNEAISISFELVDADE